MPAVDGLYWEFWGLLGGYKCERPKGPGVAAVSTAAAVAAVAVAAAATVPSSAVAAVVSKDKIITVTISTPGC